jgi:hypothetical protein
MWWEYIFTLWGAVIVMAVGVTLSSIAAAIAKQWRKAREAEAEAALKADMIAQGRSADEIERVLRATGRPPGQSADEE